jgi:hypothetical protein
LEEVAPSGSHKDEKELARSLWGKEEQVRKGQGVERAGAGEVRRGSEMMAQLQCAGGAELR